MIESLRERGIGEFGSSLGVGFADGACSAPRLIGLAEAFEQATKRRVPPPSTP